MKKQKGNDVGTALKGNSYISEGKKKHLPQGVSKAEKLEEEKGEGFYRRKATV